MGTPFAEIPRYSLDRIKLAVQLREDMNADRFVHLLQQLCTDLAYQTDVELVNPYAPPWRVPNWSPALITLTVEGPYNGETMDLYRAVLEGIHDAMLVSGANLPPVLVEHGFSTSNPHHDSWEISGEWSTEYWRPLHRPFGSQPT